MTMIGSLKEAEEVMVGGVRENFEGIKIGK